MRKLSEIMVQSGILIYREITRLALFSLVCSAVLIPIGFFFSDSHRVPALVGRLFSPDGGSTVQLSSLPVQEAWRDPENFPGGYQVLPSIRPIWIIDRLICADSCFILDVLRQQKRHGLLYTRCIPDLFCHHVFCVTTVHITSGHSTGNRIFPCCEPEHQAVFEASSLYDRGLFSGCLCYGDAGPYRGRVYGFIPGSDGHLSEQGNGKSDPYP